MAENEENKRGLVAAPESRELPIGIHFILAVIFLLGAIIYTISPIDIIPDILGPIGWVDDIMVWVVAIMVDLNIILKKSFSKGKEHLKRSKQRDSFI